MAIGAFSFPLGASECTRGTSTWSGGGKFFATQDSPCATDPFVRALHPSVLTFDVSLFRLGCTPRVIAHSEPTPASLEEASALSVSSARVCKRAPRYFFSPPRFSVLTRGLSVSAHRHSVLAHGNSISAPDHSLSSLRNSESALCDSVSAPHSFFSSPSGFNCLAW